MIRDALGPASAPTKRQDYRPDIDGLRAIAILPVVLFHTGVSQFSGGFVGVDIFFVISGYLITGHLYLETLSGRVSIAGFYARRVRRIAPALLAVLLATFVAAWFLLVPQQLVSFAKSLLSAEFFLSNVWFWKQSGYFAPTSGLLPLLHTWSLAVEEQFYIVIPMLVALLARRGRALHVTLVILALASFGLSWMGVVRYPGAAFYLIPTRAWELLIGSLLAIGAVAIPQRRLWCEIVAILGMALIAAAVFGITEKSRFPDRWLSFPAWEPRR